MSNAKTTPPDMAKVLNEILQDYVIEVKDTYGNCGREVAEIAVQALQQGSPKNSGDYAKSWTYKEEKKGLFGSPTFIIYNRDHYRLTHLLEYGHVLKNGTGVVGKGHVGANTHIKDVEEKVKELLPLFMEQELGGK